MKDGSQYTGIFVQDEMTGQGCHQWYDDAVYVGQFKKGKRHGHGKWTQPSGLLYEGQWQEGIKHGHGELIWGDGSRCGDAACREGCRQRGMEWCPCMEWCNQWSGAP